MVDRRTFLCTAGLFLAAMATGGAFACSHRLVVERHRVPLVGLRRPLRTAFLTDLHYGPHVSARRVASWVDAVTAHHPELILLGGDLVDRWVGADLEPLVREIGRLARHAEVLGVWGNHDHAGVAHLDAFSARLREVGVRMLLNESARIRDDLRVAGIDDLRTGRPSLRAALQRGSGQEVTLLLSHNPDALVAVPDSVDLALAGHTHGGQVCLPGGVPIVTSSQYGRRFAAGWVDAPVRSYVSRGLGWSLLPVRTFCPPEVTVLDLVPAHDARPSGSGGAMATLV